jgi:hypothetical protein
MAEPPIGIPVRIHCKNLEVVGIPVAFFWHIPLNLLMIAIKDPEKTYHWDTTNPRGHIVHTDSWELFHQEDLPLLISYEYKWPLFEELLKGTIPWPSPQ